MRSNGWMPVLVLAGLILSCGGPKAPDSEGHASVANVTYSPEAVTVSHQTVRRDLLYASDDGQQWVFSEKAGESSALTAGKILVIPGVALRRVTHRRQSGGRVYILTEQATLTEAVRDAELTWSVPVRFRKAKSAAGLFSVPVLELFQPTVAYAAGVEPIVQTHERSGEIEGWHYKASAAVGGDKADLLLEVHSKVKGFEISLTGKGYLQNFETYATIMIRDSKLKYFDFRNQRLNGEMKYELVWAKKPHAVDPENAEFKLPATITIPLRIGPIPFQLAVSEAILITPGMGAQGGGRYKFLVRYDGNQGFRLEGDNFLTEARMQARGFVEETFSASLAGHAFLIGVSAPRIELKTGFSVLGAVKQVSPNSVVKSIAEMLEKNPLDKLLPPPMRDIPNKLKTDGAASVQIVTLATYLSSGPLSLIPCRKMKVIVQCKVGASATVLGQKLPDKSYDVWKNEHVETWPKGVKCAE